MAPLEYTMDGNVAVLTMNSGENRFNFPFFDAYLKALDEIEQSTQASVLVITSAHEKIWCNGIDLDWLLPAVQKEGQGLMQKFSARMYELFRRVLLFPAITVGAMNGHAFAGGAFLAFCCDFRFMRSDRGWICLPEVDLKMQLGPVLTAISRRAVPQYKFEEMQYTGRRLTARECEEHHIVTRACHMDDLMQETMAFARSMDKDREILRGMKAMTHKDLVATIDEFIATARSA